MSAATQGLTMRGEKRAADPSALFRPGGRSIGAIARAIPVPAGVPGTQVPEFFLDAFLTGVDYATQAAKQRARDQSREPSSGHFVRRDGRRPPGAHPQNSARVAGANPRSAAADAREGVSSRDCRGASRVPAPSEA